MLKTPPSPSSPSASRLGNSMHEEQLDRRNMAAWMEVKFEHADGDSDWTLGYVVLMPDHTLAYFTSDASLDCAPTQQLRFLPKLDSVVQVETPPYNYEHAFEVSGKTVGSGVAQEVVWTLCPERAEDAKAWMEAVKHA